MKAKLGETTVDVWKISTEKPENGESWVLDEFEKRQLSWSGKLVIQAAVKFDEKTASSAERAASWMLIYGTPSAFANTQPYDIYLLVNQARIPAFGQLGEYLVKMPDKSLVVYSEKRFKELTIL